MAHKERHTASKKKGGAVKILLAVVLLLVLAAGAAGVFAYNEIHGNGKPGTEVTVSIRQGSGVAAIAQELKDAGVIRSAYLFRWYVGHKGAAAKLQYGDFALTTGSAYDDIISALSTYAKAETVRITIPEGTTAIAIARKMEEAGLCNAEDFLKEANEGDFSAYTFWQYVPEDKDAPDRFMKCEGYLFPETYEFLKGDTVHNYVATFYAQFDAQITDAMYAKLKEQGMTLNELVTLASFVQEEAGNSQDSNVAQVFRNRLAEGSPYPRLQSNTSSHIQSDADNNYLWNWVALVMSSGEVSRRTRITFSPFAFQVSASSAVNTTLPQAAPGEAPRPLPIGVATFRALASNCGCSRVSRFLGSIIRTASSSVLCPSSTRSQAICRAACAVLLPLRHCSMYSFLFSTVNSISCMS